MAKALAAVGIPCTVILDAAVGYIMERVNAVMLGAEGVCENGGIINKVIKGSFKVLSLCLIIFLFIYVFIFIHCNACDCGLPSVYYFKFYFPNSQRLDDIFCVQSSIDTKALVL